MKTIWQVEIDEYCRRVLARHFPDAERFGDIRECGRHNLRPVDVICGGFPCQDISQCNTTGNAQGIDGERSGLWGELFRVVCELRPRVVVVENSPILTYRGLGRVLGDLASCGYDAEWQCLPAASFGAPHLRDRIWLLAYPRREPGVGVRQLPTGCHLVLPEGEDRDEAERGEDWELVALVPGVHQGVAADWWRAQSGVARSAHGISAGMDRRRAIGNAVVPQVAEWIGRRIVEAQ